MQTSHSKQSLLTFEQLESRLEMTSLLVPNDLSLASSNSGNSSSPKNQGADSPSSSYSCNTITVKANYGGVEVEVDLRTGKPIPPKPDSSSSK